MHYSHAIDGCLDAAIGRHGLTRDELDGWIERASPAFLSLRDRALKGTLPHFALLDDMRDIEAAEAALAALCRDARELFVLGTGGSSLGGQTLAQLGGWSIPGDHGGPGREARPRLRFYDNLDARSFARALSMGDLEATRFLVISKSGSTAETLSQMLTVLAALDRQGLKRRAGELFLAVSDPREPGKANGLRDLCDALAIPVLDHPPGVGGRYSALSIVGLLPLISRGLDPRAARAGARSVVARLIQAERSGDFAPAVGAALNVALARERGATIAVMMPYADKLRRFAAWHVQLWAESLGKNGEGTTPIAALGPVDQHSQLQLFLDGPRHHFMTIMRVGDADESLAPMPEELARLAGAAYLGGRRMGDLAAAQARAIADVFVEAKRPVRVIDIPRLDEAAMGALMMHFMIETILAAALLGVNPYDQPAVELGKRITRDYLAQSPAGAAAHADPAVAADHRQPHRGG